MTDSATKESSGAVWSGITARAATVVVLIGLGVSFTGWGGATNVILASMVCVYGIAAIGQGWLMGRAGLVSFGGAAFMGIGAFSAGLLARAHVNDIIVMLAVCVALGAIVGLIIGVIGLRFNGIYLLLATTALQFIGEAIFNRVEGANPLLVTSSTLLGIELVSPKTFYIVSLVSLLALIAFMNRILNRTPGRIWLAMRDHEAAASTMGIDVRAWRLKAFVGSSIVTTCAGGLFAVQLGSVDYNTFSLDLALGLVIIVFIGGVNATILGSLVGATVYVMLPTWVAEAGGAFGSSFQNNLEAVSSLIEWALLLIVLVYSRDGIVGYAQRLFASTRKTMGGRWKGRQKEGSAWHNPM